MSDGRHLADAPAAKSNENPNTSNFTDSPPSEGNGQKRPLIFPLHERPTWRRDPKALTFLKTCHPRRLAAKQWIGSASQAIDYDLVKFWRPFVAFAENLDQLGEILMRAEALPRVMAIRGAVRSSAVSKERINRIYRIDREEEPDLEDAPRHALMIDIDSKPEPPHFNWLNDPARAALWAAEAYLPSAWKGVRFFYQYSGGAGIKPGLRLHFWYWMGAPKLSADLRADFVRRYGKSLFDLSVFTPNQPHYTAAPIFINRADPLAGRRCGFAGGAQ